MEYETTTLDVKLPSFELTGFDLIQFEKLHQLCKQIDEALNKLPSYQINDFNSISSEEVIDTIGKVQNAFDEIKEINFEIIPNFKVIPHFENSLQ